MGCSFLHERRLRAQARKAARAAEALPPLQAGEGDFVVSGSRGSPTRSKPPELVIAGIDEAGRGPLAGPVVAAAVILPVRFSHPLLTDSKQLSPAVRETLYEELTALPGLHWAVAIVDAEEVDRLNILRATHEAMRRAVAGLPVCPGHVLIDGCPVHPFPVEQTALVGGDGLSYSIAAASIFAKVTRDRLMVEMDALYPGYHFARHKGYGTKLHLDMIDRHGPSPIHRRSFSPVRQLRFDFD
ncbi:MAG TPA: ribonuclease HII [Chthoniobacteraceae bacterium]|nr:ribonuclease HII [Chthoniobacteraceae bacterium]